MGVESPKYYGVWTERKVWLRRSEGGLVASRSPRVLVKLAAEYEGQVAVIPDFDGPATHFGEPTVFVEVDEAEES